MVELNSKSLGALKRLSDESSLSLSDDEFGTLIAAVFDSYAVNMNTGTFEINHDLIDTAIEAIWVTKANKKSALEIKETMAAVHMLIAELARHNSDKASAGALLEEFGFNSSRVKLFTDSYQKKIKTVRLFLSCMSDSLPHVVDVNWRLDYCIKESNQERLNEPVFVIELKVERPDQDGLSTIKFLCNIEQLQDLVYKLKEATKAVEKLAQ